jgi:hypothetical protein
LGITQDEKLLKEIRDNFDKDMAEWRPIRDEATTDMRYVAGDPWDPIERKARKDEGRLCLSFDELGQYINQLVNSVKQNKRAIKVIPAGNGASDKTAEMRAGLIRQIEYRSNAQSAYTTGFENAVQRSYGFWRVITKYKDPRKTADRELRIQRIPNPDTVLLDQFCKEADCSDMEHAFVLESYTEEEFARKWPNAEKKSFDSADMALAPAWIKAGRVQVAEYWKVKHNKRVVADFPDGSVQPLDEIGSPAYDPKTRTLALSGAPPIQVIGVREIDERSVCQYITNGVEILEENDWPGTLIPIVPVYGKELYIDRGAGAKRELMSLIRLARDPLTLYCSYRTQQAETAKMSPMTPWVGYEGQFDTETDWATLHKIPTAYAEVKAMLDASGQAVLPLPQRQTYDPPIQSLELGAEAARRAIQAAMGINALPTAAQRNNEKSGVALERISTQSAQGSFHFIDNFDIALELTGRILNELIDSVYDTEGREEGIRKPDDTYKIIKMNTSQPYPDEAGNANHYPVSVGQHEVTISTGPSYQSQREEANAFMDTLANAHPELFARFADLAIKHRNLGPLGDEMAARVTPPEFLSQDGKDPLDPRAAAVVREAQGQLQQMQEAMGELQKQLNELQLERKGRLIEADTKKEIAAIQADVDKFKITVDAHVKGEQMESNEEIAQLRVDMQWQIAQLEARLEKFKIENQPEPEPQVAE